VGGDPGADLGGQGERGGDPLGRRGQPLLPALGEELSRLLGMLAGVGRPVRVAQPLL
jgi:hypothetical protein